MSYKFDWKQMNGIITSHKDLLVKFLSPHHNSMYMYAVKVLVTQTGGAIVKKHSQLKPVSPITDE